tara:strand:+ start:719 stop:1006 length:288 start_codon:yes stop_codon:yes gene_type:complete
MSDDDGKIEIGATDKEGIIILRRNDIPVFIHPKGTEEETIDVQMQISFIKFCMNKTEYVTEFLDYIEEQERLIQEQEDAARLRKKRKGFTLIKKT